MGSSVIYFSPIFQPKRGKYGSNRRGVYEVILTKLIGEEMACGGRNLAWSMIVHGLILAIHVNRKLNEQLNYWLDLNFFVSTE